MTKNSEADHVDAALDNLETIKNGGSPDTPETPDTEPTRTTSGTPSLSGGYAEAEERKVREYLKEWYDNETPEDFEVDLSELEIRVDATLKRAHGKFKYSEHPDGTVDQQLKISKNAMETHSWDEVKSTIRHEAVHAWQYQNGYDLSHGRSFKQWMDTFDIDVYAENPAEKKAKYEIICPNCGVVGQKTRACKTTKHIDRYHCQGCGSEDLSVRQNH